jgi:hypothetical protein
VRPFIECWAATRSYLREITPGDVDTILEHLSGGRTVLPMTAEEIRAIEQAAVTPAQRLAIALAAVHAARPKAIRELTLDDIDLPSRRITLAGHWQPLGDLAHNALLAWLEYRRAAWPNTANRHVLVSRISGLGGKPVSADFLDKHQLRGISLERIRRDRILHEALATGADSLHLSLVFSIDHTNAMAYANAALNLLSSPAEQVLSRRPRQARGHAEHESRRGRPVGVLCPPGPSISIPNRGRRWRRSENWVRHRWSLRCLTA